MSRKNRNRQNQIQNVQQQPAAHATEKHERVMVPTMQNEMKLANGLADAVGFNSGPGIGGGINPGWVTGSLGVPAISDTTTAYENLRWFLVSNFRQLLSELYVEIGLVQTVVNVPVDDGLRGGFMFKSKQLDEQQVKDLQLTMERENDFTIAGWAAKWSRLFGGGGIIILVDDQDPEEPLDLKSISKDSKVKYRAVDMWELFWDKQNIEGYDADIQSDENEFYNYYSENLHSTRVLKLQGVEAPSFIRPRLRGWGLSAVEPLIRSMNQYMKATDLGFEVLDEFKLDVYKIKNLINTLMSPNGTQAVQQRVQLANWQKNYQNAVVMDAEDDFDHKQLSFAGLAEAMEGIRHQVAADMRMPAIKLFGQSFSSGGMGTSSIEEMENYNSMVEAEVRNKLKWHFLKMGEIRCQQKFGFIPDDLEGEFKPLRELSAVDQETVKTQKFTRLVQAKTAGEISTLEFRDSSNKGNLFDIQLDTSEDGINPDDPEITDILAGDAAEEDDGGEADNDPNNEPGANDEPTEKVAPQIKVRMKVKNELEPYSSLESIVRIFNSAAFDKASYEADGGDSWVASGRKELLSKDAAKDQSLYERCDREMRDLFGEDKWQFTVWLYKKQGGRFI